MKDDGNTNNYETASDQFPYIRKMIILALSTIPSCRQSFSKTAKFLSKQMNT